MYPLSTKTDLEFDSLTRETVFKEIQPYCSNLTKMSKQACLHLLFSHRTITLICQSVPIFGSLKKVNLKSFSAPIQRQKLGSGKASRADCSTGTNQGFILSAGERSEISSSCWQNQTFLSLVKIMKQYNPTKNIKLPQVKQKYDYSKFPYVAWVERGSFKVTARLYTI